MGGSRPHFIWVANNWDRIYEWVRMETIMIANKCIEIWPNKSPFIMACRTIAEGCWWNISFSLLSDRALPSPFLLLQWFGSPHLRTAPLNSFTHTQSFSHIYGGGESPSSMHVPLRSHSPLSLVEHLGRKRLWWMPGICGQHSSNICAFPLVDRFCNWIDTNFEIQGNGKRFWMK